MASAFNDGVFRIAFVTDTHLGYTAYKYTDDKGINLRVRDGELALHEVVKGILESPVKIDAVLHGGDVFHRSEPSIRDIYMFQHYSRLLHKHGIPSYLDSGNHDTPDNRAKMPAISVLNDPDKSIHALWKPYEVMELAEGLVLHSVGHHGLKGDSIPQVKVTPGAVNIFTSHGAALDPKNATLMSCKDSPREQIIPNDIVIDEDFSVKLLGHYHSRYAVGHELLNTWYGGSTLRRGFSDEPGPRGWMLVEIYPDGTTKITPHNIRQRPQYDLKAIDADGMTAKEVQDRIEENILTTRRDEGEGGFNPSEAPIVRQKVINAARSVRAGLDRGRINGLTTHMLNWDLVFSMPEKTAVAGVTAADTDQVSLSKMGAGQATTAEFFNKWSDTSQSLQGLSDKEKDAVKKKAVAHLEAVRSGKEG